MILILCSKFINVPLLSLFLWIGPHLGRKAFETHQDKELIPVSSYILHPPWGVAFPRGEPEPPDKNPVPATFLPPLAPRKSPHLRSSPSPATETS